MITLCYVNVGLRAFKFIAQKPVRKGSEGNRELSCQSFGNNEKVSRILTLHKLSTEKLIYTYTQLNDVRNNGQHILNRSLEFAFPRHRRTLRLFKAVDLPFALVAQGFNAFEQRKTTPMVEYGSANRGDTNIGYRSVAIPCSALPRVPT